MASTGSCARRRGCSSGPTALAVRSSGPEAADYLQGQLTNDVEALEPGEGCYSALLDRKGHMQGDMRVLRARRTALRIDTEAIAGDAVLRHLSMYKIGREVEVADGHREPRVISVIGPVGRAVALGGPAGPENAHRDGDVGGVPSASPSRTDLGRRPAGGAPKPPARCSRRCAEARRRAGQRGGGRDRPRREPAGRASGAR